MHMCLPPVLRYGTDCSRKAAGLPIEPPTLFTSRPWLSAAARMPTSAQPYNGSASAGGGRAEGRAGGRRPGGGEQTAEEEEEEGPQGLRLLQGGASGLLRRREGGGGGGGGGGGRAGLRGVSRKRPYIYVYDLPPEYNARMLQYKINPTACSWRLFHGWAENFSDFNSGDNGYSIETFLHEAMLMSSHRYGRVWGSVRESGVEGV